MKKAEKSFKVTWKKGTGDGYQIQYSTNKKGEQVENADYSEGYAKLYDMFAKEQTPETPDVSLVSVNFWSK